MFGKLPLLFLIASASFVATSAFSKDYWKYLLRAMASYRLSCAWARFVVGDARMREIARHEPSLMFRLQRPYLRAGLTKTQKLRCLTEHYRWLLDAWPQTLLTALLHEGRVTLARIPCESDYRYRIDLMPAGRYGKEGELTMALMIDDEPLMLAAFAVHRLGLGEALNIGCLQGIRHDEARALQKQATRDMHGLRPKQALLVALYAFAEHYGVRQIFGVPNDAHIYQGNARTRERVRADFDDFWIEMGAFREGFHFHLPASLPRKPIEAVPSHKRAQYRRRYALEQSMQVSIQETLAAAAMGVERTHAVGLLPHRAAA